MGDGGHGLSLLYYCCRESGAFDFLWENGKSTGGKLFALARDAEKV